MKKIKIVLYEPYYDSIKRREIYIIPVSPDKVREVVESSLKDYIDSISWKNIDYATYRRAKVKRKGRIIHIDKSALGKKVKDVIKEKAYEQLEKQISRYFKYRYSKTLFRKGLLDDVIEKFAVERRRSEVAEEIIKENRLPYKKNTIIRYTTDLVKEGILVRTKRGYYVLSNEARKTFL